VAVAVAVAAGSAVAVATAIGGGLAVAVAVAVAAGSAVAVATAIAGAAPTCGVTSHTATMRGQFAEGWIVGARAHRIRLRAVGSNSAGVEISKKTRLERMRWNRAAQADPWAASTPRHACTVAPHAR
jgi:hypothetical protein